jgi:uncharacterized membrane protein
MKAQMILAAVAAILALASGVGQAGPNAGGSLVVHDTGLTYSDEGYNYCGKGDVPSTCQDVDARIDDDGVTWIWKVYAAFPSTSQPRLKAVAYGWEWDPEVVILQVQHCTIDVLYHSSTYVSCCWMGLQDVHTTHLTELGWFAGYHYGAPATFRTRGLPHEECDSRAWFGDDSVPMVQDSVAAFGYIGFGIDGYVPCPVPPVGACCAPAGTCTVTTQSACVAPNAWQGGSTSCSPNPCISSGVDDGPLATTLGFRVAPTPFAERTALVFAGPKATEASLLIFDVSGRRVRSAWQGVLTGRTITLEWDGCDDSGRKTPAGVYLARLRSGAGVVDARLVQAR